MIHRHLLLAILMGAGLAWGCGGDGGGASGPATNEPDGPFATGTTTFTFVDTSRPTAANGSAPAKDSRTLRTAVYYPAEGEPGAPFATTGAAPLRGRRFPLVVFAHGFTAVGRIYLVTLQAWAEAGYVVAAPDFPLSNGQAEGGATLSDYVNQPGDVSFVIDEMLRLDGDPASLMHGVIDAERIGAAGQSLGGFTTFGVAFNTCCHDARIGAAVPMAGRLSPFPDGEYFAGIEVPILIIHGDADDTVPYASALEAYALAAPPKFLLTHLGGGHILPYVGRRESPDLAATIDASTAFFDHFLKRERGSLDRLLVIDSREGVALDFEAAGEAAARRRPPSWIGLRSVRLLLDTIALLPFKGKTPEAQRTG